ncbi:hypothetical protein BV25DRAFT_1819457 [Artomyces pyxidatus]|uniref:Uncharacterized protein n=1 Tax=Artomyces pyxidatus TaxID=48021 RepID=A0ACB8TFG5_9AGAM|nr:hypothetical protein BV25DRAFT_1819457 [Artomyces pyxidatus]
MVTGWRTIFQNPGGKYMLEHKLGNASDYIVSPGSYFLLTLWEFFGHRHGDSSPA